MIAYLQLPLQSLIIDRQHLIQQIRGIESFEVDSARSAYISLEPWMSKPRIQEMYLALRSIYGHHIRFGAAMQKTTARAAALYRPYPHMMIITPEKTDEFLSSLPIKLLPGLGQRTTKFLEARGVTTFSAFRNLSYQTLKDWFGVSGIILQQFAKGIDPRVVQVTRGLTA
jgi:nucleotidyltransferase/DNA polymerase involved in DNA repair